MKSLLPRKWRRQTPVFIVGVGLFAVGVAGFAFEAWQMKANQLDRLVSHEVVFMAQGSTESLANINDSELTPYLPNWLTQDPQATADVAGWIGSEVALLALDNRQYILGARYRNKSALKTWLRTNLLPGEEFVITNTDKGEVWSPDFSSAQAFLIMDRWVFVGDSLATLQKAFDHTAPLAENSDYKAAFAGLSSYRDGRLYVDLKRLLASPDLDESWVSYGPLLTALGQTLPSFGFTAKSDEGRWEIDSKFILSDLVAAADAHLKNTKNNTIPDLAYYAPSETMFFLNGQNLHERYNNTKVFLKELNPQFEIIFDGLLRAQINRWFGDEVDFEKDFLQSVQGPYAILLDYSDGVNWAFITESEVGDKIETLLKAAQGNFAPRVEVVELPDGTTREELVATPPAAIQIETVEHNGWTYSATQGPSLSQGELLFLQQGNYFLLSSSRDLLEEALEAKKKESASLANNRDFRQAVLFKLGQAESFLFFNMNKWRKALEPLNVVPIGAAEAEAPEPTWWQGVLNLPIRNAILSRKIEDNNVIVKWLLFMN